LFYVTDDSNTGMFWLLKKCSHAH